MRASRFAGIAIAALFTSACFQSTTLIRINDDGSGTIEQTTIVTDAAMKQLRALVAMGSGADKPIDLFSTTQARQMAAKIGTDVSLVSSTRIKTAAGEGTKAVFAFADINRLQLKPEGDGAGMASMARGVDPAQLHFSLTRQPNGDALLRIVMPPAKMPAAGKPTAPAGSGGSPQSHMSPEQLAMVKQMFAGMKIAIAVEPAGRLVKTSSPYVDGGRVTLVEFSFDELLAHDGIFARMHTAQTLDDVRAAMKDIPGLRINLDPEITIEFAAAAK